MINFFTESNLKHVADVLSATPRQVRKAAGVATTKALQWANREAASRLAKASGIPYRAARIRVKRKRGTSGNGIIWFGLNPVSAKYLKDKDKAGAFTNESLNDHFFKRKGKARLPIQRLEKPIDDYGEKLIEGPLCVDIQERLVTEFFIAMDKTKGLEIGASQNIFNS